MIHSKLISHFPISPFEKLLLDQRDGYAKKIVCCVTSVIYIYICMSGGMLICVVGVLGEQLL